MVTTVKDLKQQALLKHKEYEIAFEFILERIISKMSFEDAVREDHRQINPAEFMRWIIRNSDNKERYYEALAIRAELLSEELIEIADGKHSEEDVARSQLRIKTRKEQMSTSNRPRFGDIKQLEVTGGISVSHALEEARSRVLTIGQDAEDAFPLPSPITNKVKSDG